MKNMPVEDQKGGEHPSPKRRKTEQDDQDEAPSEAAKSGNAEHGSQKESPIALEKEASSTILSEAQDDDIATILNSTGKLIGSGHAGYVYEGKWKGRKVAVKLWSGADYEGITQIRTEIATYGFVCEEYPSVLGDAVPAVHVYWNRGSGLSREKIGIVTDFVGNAIEYDPCKAKLKVIEDGADYFVPEDDKEGLYKEALRRLEVLHKVNVLHGSVRLRNMRVERVKAPRSSCSEPVDNGSVKRTAWRVWWVDLGRSSVLPKGFELDQYSTRHESRRCWEAIYCGN